MDDTGPIIVLRLELPLPPAELHPNYSKRLGHGRRAAVVRSAKTTAYMVALEAILKQNLDKPVFELATVRSHFVTSTGRHDGHNLSMWLKAYLDGLEAAGVIDNDRGFTIEPPKQRRATYSGELGVTLEIFATSEQMK